MVKINFLVLTALFAILSSCSQSGYRPIQANGISLAPAEEAEADTCKVSLVSSTGISVTSWESNHKVKPLVVATQTKKVKRLLENKAFRTVSSIRQASSQEKHVLNSDTEPTERKPINNTSFITGLLSLIFSVISVFTFFMAFFALAFTGTSVLAFLSFIFSLAGLVTGVVSLVSAKPDKRNFTGFAVPGVLIGAIMFLLSLVLGLVLLLLYIF